MNPESLYHALIQIQELVEQVELSTGDRISWPIVSYCDHLWELLFPKKTVEIFYSVFAEHNFGIHSFTHRLKLLLENVLPPSEIASIISTRNVYCLQIASLEDENLPLYANIGHEFGHALYWAKETEIVTLLTLECQNTFAKITDDLKAQDPTSVGRRANRCAWIIVGVATELFCDLVGYMIAGPAFTLSLYEMGWGDDQNRWSVKLSPKDSTIRAYPSFAFRLSCVNGNQASEFENELRRHIETHPSDKVRLKGMPEHLAAILTDHSKDRVALRPIADQDAIAIEEVLQQNLPLLKKALELFLEKCRTNILIHFFKMEEFTTLSVREVFELLRRLDNDILPNIIPGDTLLGEPATFATILNASALYRMKILSDRNGSMGSEEINIQVQKIERLTAKALEVSYVQREYTEWNSTQK